MPPRELSRDLVRVVKSLKLGKLLPTLPERLRQARDRGLDPEDVLLLLLSEEVQRRDQNRLAARAQRAQLAPSMVFDAWDADAKITYDRQLLDQLRLLHFLEKHHHVLIMGPVGVGKTMLAHALGRRVEALRRLVYVFASVATALAVTTAGTIGFVGLVVPHALRLALGNDQRMLLPASALAGGTLLLLADTAARSMLAPQQLPVGVITALVGVPAFMLLLLRNPGKA